jgi:hypothetical protein
MQLFIDSANITPKKERVIVYVDGFNLYFGLLEAGFNNCSGYRLFLHDISTS